ncbi:uncharacterized protein B0H64DRAFT_478725 [Chaetomium fimeti]|uniref:Uncharacterized protein n=1 Tax=Chaetomium fimeti TaxID=1854472 RepID=A0AAE0H6I4_9PEZI|nr:hypothetical protein B0H64DRAFT_478725 [Chaetomium fimeti]
MSTIEVAGSSTNARANDQGLFQCGSCKRHYNRLDHLARHVRSHTNFKPHRCSICGKSFSRTDLLKRHVAAHDVRSAKVNNLSRGAADDVPGRVSQACRACAANHVRCTEAKPCRRCAEKGLECVYKSDDLLTPASPLGSQASEQEPSPSPMPSSLEAQMTDAMPLNANYTDAGDVPQRFPTQPLMGPSTPLQRGVPPQNSYQGTGPGPSMGPVVQQPFVDDFMDPHPELPTGCCTPTFAEWNFLPGLWSAGNLGMGVEQPFPGIDLDDLDLRFLDTYNTTIPFELGGPPLPEPSHMAPSMGMSSVPHPATSASEAFRNHHWRFRPNPKDHGAAEEHNLSLPSDARDHPSPESQIAFSRRVTPVRLGSAARDNILTIVIKSIRPENLHKAVASFPSVELLDTLIQFYLTSPHARADSFIHAASFNPNEKKPELLIAMAAAGAVLTSDSTLTKLGYAMQECLRTAIPFHWEADNTMVRNLELTQAFLINLEIALWSGHSRKVEITESFLQSPLTMVRRGGRFKKSSYPPVILDTNDPTASEETAWRTWIHQESFKRTAFRFVQHDLNSSMYLMVNPLVSYAELSLPLPCAPSLWAAPSSHQWTALLTQHPPLAHQPPSIADYLDDPGAFKSQSQFHHAHPILDLPIANEAFLACAWSLAWECIQLTSLQRSNNNNTATNPTSASSPTKPRRWNTFLLTSRREELLKLLEHFRLSLATPDTPPLPHPPPPPHHGIQTAAREVRMRLELILLHLHAPFEDIQIFAGIEGPEQARGAYAAVLEWAGTEAARRAICHAGQVLRFARGVGRGMLLGPAAVVMYQASLVLWVYALLAGAAAGRGRGRGMVPVPTGEEEGGREVVAVVGPGPDAVWLDGEDDLALQRFTHFGVGAPGLAGLGMGTADGSHRGGGEVSLGEPEGVLGVVIGILRDNYEGLPRPNLVERLLQLMEALQRSSAGMMEFHGQLNRQ